MEDFAFPTPVLLDEVGEVDAWYNASNTPTTLFVDAESNITARRFSRMIVEQIDGYIEQLGDSE